MILLLALLCAGVALAQTEKASLASFTGTIKHIDSTTLTLARLDQDDMEISCSRKTHYYSGSQKIKRTDLKPGDRVMVETTLDLYLKPEAVNVHLLPPVKP